MEKNLHEQYQEMMADERVVVARQKFSEACEEYECTCDWRPLGENKKFRFVPEDCSCGKRKRCAAQLNVAKKEYLSVLVGFAQEKGFDELLGQLQ